VKTLLLFLLLSVSFGFTNSSAKPKIKAKDGIVTVDGAPYLKYEYKRVVGGYDFMNLNGDKLFFLRGEDYYDPARISKSNTTGKVSYASLIREGGTEVLCELDTPNPKYVAWLLYDYAVLDDKGNIVEANFQKMATQVGMTYSAGRPATR
jgi:hypothetical protein